MATHELVCSGIRRRIGDGRSTLIWGHPWLPDDPSPMVQSSMPSELNGSLVSGLIDPGSGSWDISILEDLFTPADIDRIMSVPISPHHEDSWFWLGDPKGCYTVKEGYRRIMGDIAIQPGAYDKWLHLWKIKRPAKWKIFIWRALSNILPTTTNLILKRVEIDPTCPMCGTFHESIMHSLILCEFSRLVWHESSLHIPSVIGDEFLDWFENAITVLTNEDMFVTLAVLYHIWRARNHAVWDGYLPTPARVWREANAAAAAWRHVHGSQVPYQPQTTTLPIPGDGMPRCFFDADFRSQSRTATVGAVLLAPTGEFVASFNAQLPSCFSPLMAESLACKEVLSWLKDRGLPAVCILTDCSTLRDLLVSNTTGLFSYVDFSVEASKALMLSFESCSVSLIPRSHNRGAHALAAAAFSQVAPMYWDSVPPNSIAHLI
ncbi:uncharacterized protein LOC116015822 [Ipomoea triloba]|uniref:uncharacterized protein LOC116015822 n=1 Tax=Ipomoea triloba TaxID=35885 RepID=UPI00125D38A5|nr:uncharacterized protein LOC116015822 [Ipomoea triloba]